MAKNHDPRDGVAAAERARTTYTPYWHPVLAAVELEPGHWELRDQYANSYAVIRIVRRGTEIGYRAVTWAEKSEDRRLVGYYRTLRSACAAAHRVYLRSHGRMGGAR